MEIRKVIRIDKNSIKENPDYGKDYIYVKGNRTGEITVKGKVPDFFQDEVNVIQIQEQILDISNKQDSEKVFFILDFSILEKLDELIQSSGYNLSYVINNNIERVEIGEQSKYFFKYENTPLMCIECGESTGYNDITYGEENNEEFPQCKNCSCTDSFEPYILEPIENALRK